MLFIVTFVINLGADLVVWSEDDQCGVRIRTLADDAEAATGELDALAKLRRAYEELASAAKALETAIQRGYLDIRVDGG